MLDAIGEHVRERAQEFGTTTGRPRRCGWFDAVAGRFSNRINGFTGMALTRFDILDDLDTVKICTAYRVDGRTITAFPASIPALERCEPIYEELPGWKTSTCDVRNFNDLPPNARKYVRRVEQLIGCPASIISVGAERGQTVVKRPVV
jgi:adenylosuccinate synthase